jgi:RNA 2',3'-cyclic 3'-phosphodiesterase
MRLFVALAPPPAVIADLNAACAPFRPARGDLRWTSTEAWHITLAFLGEVGEERLDRLLPRLERGARRHGALRLSLRGAGAFPSPRRANVLWTGLSGDRKALADLAATVTAASRRAGAAPPDAGRRFRPHLTLARCRAPVSVSQIVADLEGYEGPPWQAEEIYLIRSRPNDVPRFETLGTYKLRPRIEDTVFDARETGSSPERPRLDRAELGPSARAAWTEPTQARAPAPPGPSPSAGGTTKRSEGRRHESRRAGPGSGGWFVPPGKAQCAGPGSGGWSVPPGNQAWLSFSRIGAAARRIWTSSGDSSRMRWVSQASLRRRTRSTSARPSSVTVSTTCLRSVGWADRRTRPRSSRTAITLVIEGGCTFS